MRPINRIIVHRSQLEYGNFDTMHRIHVIENYWSYVGYEELIYNGYPTWKSYVRHKPDVASDGLRVKGRPYEIGGAHTIDWSEDHKVITNYNHDSIGVCLMGMDSFTSAQLITLRTIVRELRAIHGNIPVYGHDELLTVNPENKVCPNIDMDHLREFLDAPNPETFIGPPAPE